MSRLSSLGAAWRRRLSLSLTAALFILPAINLGAQEQGAAGDPKKYKYFYVQRMFWMVGDPTWSPDASGKMNVTLWTSEDEANDRANGQKVYRVFRYFLDDEGGDGTKFLDRLNSLRAERFSWQMEISSQAELAKMLRRRKHGSDLPPPNPHFASAPSNPDIETHQMGAEYLPGGPKDDAAAGSFYFPTEGASVDFINNYKVTVKDGLLYVPNGTGGLQPLDTRGITSDKPADHCLFVMDANGQIYAFAAEWIPGIFAQLGFVQINHSAIAAGHPVAAAGKMRVINGKLEYMDNSSGHYRPSNNMLVQAIKRLESMGMSRAAIPVSFKADDHPGHSFLEMDPEHETKDKKLTNRPADDGRTGGPAHGDPNARRPNSPNDAGDALKPESSTPKAPLDVDQRAAEQPPTPATLKADDPTPPPSDAVVEQIRSELAKKPNPADMDVNFLKSLYAMGGPDAAKAIAKAVSSNDGKFNGHNARLGELRKQMDLMVWKKILSERKIRVETTNQGKNNGARSDLDYTLYFFAEEAGLTVAELIAEHTKVWNDLHQMSPDVADIKVMNGDEFYPDWRNESLGSAEHEIEVKRVLEQLRGDPAKYSAPGANKEQVHNRALRDGVTEILQYDEALDKPEIPIDKQIVRDRGATREISKRYQGVSAQYNTMNALGNLIQNKGEFFSHDGSEADNATKRAKYFNRVINEGLGNNRFFANTYGQIHAGNAPNKDKMKIDFINRAFASLATEKGKPPFFDQQRDHFLDVIDISMQIEADKIANQDYSKNRQKYFAATYGDKAIGLVRQDLNGRTVPPDEVEKLLLDKMQSLFEFDQKWVLASAILAGLKQSVARDLTPEGVLRNRVRFDEKTKKFITDPEGAKKVAFERATEVALFFELVNSLPDATPEQWSLKETLRSKALQAAPNEDIRGFFEALDKVNAAEIDKFVKGDPESQVQKSLDELKAKRDQKILDLLVERKEKAAEFVRQKGLRVDPNSVPQSDVHAHILSAQADRLAPSRRAQIKAVAGALGTRIGGEFREALVQNGSALMVGSSAVNLVRAWQSSPEALGYAAFTEAINYMPDAIQTPFTAVDLLAKVKRGEYVGAAWQGGLFMAMSQAPVLGQAMLAYNIATGSLDIVHTHFVTRIDADLTEQALKSRPREEDGSPLRDGRRARANRMPDAVKSVYRGSGPGFPLYFGKYVKLHGPNTSPEYLDGTVPHDFLSDDALADSATFEFAPQIDSILRAQNVVPGTRDWAQKAWTLKRKFGFDIPFYRRMVKVYEEKFRNKIVYYENWPSPYNEEYLAECRMDVYDWYANQPPGYKLELAGDASFWFGDQTDKMQEMIARECAVVLGGIHEAYEHADEVDKSNLKALKEAMKRGFDAERALVAAKRVLHARIQADEQKAQAAIERKAIERAEKHQTQLVLSFPHTFATEEDIALLDVETRLLSPKVKFPTSVDFKQEITGAATEGAPPGWVPGKAFADDFKPDKDGWIAKRPITVPMKFTATLRDADKKQLAAGTIDLPVVAYAPTFSGSVTVKVYGLTEKGDSVTYGGALVTLGSETQETDAISGTATFVRLKAGAHSAKVAPSKGDQRHGPGSGSGVIVDKLFSNDPNAKESARIVVKLPYIPEPKVVADTSKTTTKTTTGGGTGKGATKTDSATAKAKADSAEAAAVEEAVKKLGPLTAKAETARDAAIAACKYVDAVKAQEQVVAASKQFISTAFPKGAPGDITAIAQQYDTKLEELRKFAKGETEARDHLRRGLAFITAKKGEPALTALELAEKVDNVPKCLHDQIVQTYNELKADIEKRILIIDKAVDAANNKCDYATARAFGEQVEKEDASLSWVVNELPRIKDLEKKQKDAVTLAQQADQKATLAEQAASSGDTKTAESLFNEAIALANQALQMAPACDKSNYADGLKAIEGRKTASTNPTVESSLILLLDTSGSMGSGGKMESAKEAATNAVKAIASGTEVALISYDGACAGGYRVVVGFTTQKAGLVSAIAGLSPGGGTPTAPAIGFAHDYMKRNAKGKAAQIVLMTDGQNNCGSMVDAGASLRNSNIPVRLDAVGFGLDPNGQATKDLGDIVRASGGGGNTYSANSSAELISAFRRAFITTQIKPRDPTVSGAPGTRLADLFSAAMRLLKANDMRGAVSQFKSAADQFPASPAAQFNASLAYEAAGQPLAALNHAEKYLSLAPNAFDAGSVRERVSQLKAEQAANPRAIYSPNDCSALYRWAQREVRSAGGDATRRAAVYSIMTTAQRGECPAAEKEFETYNTKYVKKPA